MESLDLSSVLNVSLGVTSSSAAVLGVAFHLLISPYEIDSHAWTLVFSYWAGIAALCTSYATFGSFTLLSSLGRSLAAGSAFNFGLLSSMLIYRGFLHRLRHIPGPFAARFSKFYHMWVAAKTLQNNLNIERLHRKYGDFVRTGPREVSINRPSAISLVYGPPAPLRKATWYGQVTSDITKANLNSIRDAEAHKPRRKVWERGLGFRALAVYEPRIRAKVEALLDKLGTGKPVDATQSASFFAFDVMGEIGFSKDFNMLESGEEHPAIKGLHEAMLAVGIVGAMPWLLAAMGKVHGLEGGFGTFAEWCHTQVNNKRAVLAKQYGKSAITEPADVMSWLIKAKAEGDPSAPPTEEAMTEESRLLVITGSDTTSGAITNALYLLAKHPEIQRKLQAAVEKEFPGGEQDWTQERTKNITYLDYIIHETLRVRPIVPVGLQRLTPAQGLQVDEVWVPGDVIVSVPCYTIQRDERYWSKPTEFIPERWETLSPEKEAYIPFTRGQFSCPGKNLAWMEMRMVLTRIALSFNVTFPPGDNMEHFERDTKDTFTTSLPPCPLVFTRK